ncbi:sulfite exporter TauE/SafE family protein [Cyanobium sp. WAJ14-Wanaka]|uniref:sulfite exporter TauE/SafE family protein n=1 Tax=Cyanobium sp. WAJ14-Wanaka TaxID=2823725 RepID=UPI0020CCDB3F|nr:sulfite exporter TauE/SafE family protein [Cyanobium sp. WAJ14-Wanaka]MCP9774868.1 sulfite exporter TauE/SafE family protein [Cyanobium sp. WAJ14-Wanaka]
MTNWILLLVAGVLCGFLNAVASSGAAITLPLLLALGLPPAVANGTNRLPVLVGFGSAIWRFHKSKAIPWRLCMRLLPCFALSALVGARLATILPMGEIRVLVHVAIALALVLLLLRPHSWMRDGDPGNTSKNPSPWLLLLSAGVGLWTGLIVLDAATYLLMSLVLVGGLTLKQANPVKAVLIFAATVVSLAVFISSGAVNWAAGLPLMVGSSLGGWLGASLALSANARVWIYRLLLGTLVLELVAMLLGWPPAAMRMPMPMASIS